MIKLKLKKGIYLKILFRKFAMCVLKNKNNTKNKAMKTTTNNRNDINLLLVRLLIFKK